MKGLKENNNVNHLSLFSATMMVIGGQIGGGIFGALGPAMEIASNNVVVAFLYGGILSLITAYSYSKIATYIDDDGGSYFEDFYSKSFFAGIPSWLLFFGYILTMSLYANTFGSFLSEVFGGNAVVKHVAISGIMLFFMIINLKGVKMSALFENILVLTKITILAIFILAGVYGVFFLDVGNINYTLPNISNPISFVGSIIMSSSIVFVAYEGLELAAVNYSHTANPKKNMPKAIMIGSSITLIVYLLVSFIARSSLTLEQITVHKEIALAIAAEPVLGQLGFILIVLGALISTSSAILATLFGTANLSKDLSDQKHLPLVFGKLNEKSVPSYSIIFVTIVTIFLANVMNLTGITAFASAAFLLVFMVVNFLAIRLQKVFIKKTIHVVGTIFILMSLITLSFYLFKEDKSSLLYIVSGFAIVLFSYVVYKLYNRKYSYRKFYSKGLR